MPFLQMLSKGKYSPKIFKPKVYKKLNKQSQEHIKKAEQKEFDSLIYISKGFILGTNQFPKDKYIGIKCIIYCIEQNILNVIDEYKTLFLQGEINEEDEEEFIKNLNKKATKSKDPNRKLILVKLLIPHQTFDIFSNDNSKVNYFLAKQICKESADLGNGEAMRIWQILSNDPKQQIW